MSLSVFKKENEDSLLNLELLEVKTFNPFGQIRVNKLGT